MTPYWQSHSRDSRNRAGTASFHISPKTNAPNTIVIRVAAQNTCSLGSLVTNLVRPIAPVRIIATVGSNWSFLGIVGPIRRSLIYWLTVLAIEEPSVQAGTREPSPVESH